MTPDRDTIGPLEWDVIGVARLARDRDADLPLLTTRVAELTARSVELNPSDLRLNAVVAALQRVLIARNALGGSAVSAKRLQAETELQSVNSVLRKLTNS